jgi:glucose 1-dehydrogenase
MEREDNRGLKEMESLKGCVCLITGGGGGMGQAIAVGFSREGGRIAVADVHLEMAQETVRLVEEEKGEAFPLEMDVTRKSSITTAVEKVENKLGPIDVLVQCAGVNSRFSFLELPEEEWDRILSINLKGTFLCGQAVARTMVKQKRGSIINISSIVAEVAVPTYAHYVASKGGVRSLTKAMAVALAPFNIRVNAIGPGPTVTPLTQKNYENPKEYNRAMTRVGLGRLAQPKDIVGAAVYLASSASEYVTGITIYVDGGILATR